MFTINVDIYAQEPQQLLSYLAEGVFICLIFGKWILLHRSVSMRGMSSLERVGLRSSCVLSSDVVPTMPTPLYHHLGFYVDGK